MQSATKANQAISATYANNMTHAPYNSYGFLCALADCYSNHLFLPEVTYFCNLIEKCMFVHGGQAQSCEMSYLLHRANISNQVLTHEKCVNRNQFNT